MSNKQNETDIFGIGALGVAFMCLVGITQISECNKSPETKQAEMQSDLAEIKQLRKERYKYEDEQKRINRYIDTQSKPKYDY